MVQKMTQEHIRERTQVLTAPLAGTVYALDNTRVREVLDRTAVTRLPKLPEPLCGVINLRGSVVPVIDLRTALGLEQADTLDGKGSIIIVELFHRSELLVVGVLTDAVGEVIDLDQAVLAPQPTTDECIGPANGGALYTGLRLVLLDLEQYLEAECMPLPDRTAA